MRQLATSYVTRLVASTVVAFVTMFLTVLALAIGDLYLTGHGYPSINRELPGIAMSLSDIVLLLAGLAAFVCTWFVLGRKTNG